MAGFTAEDAVPKLEWDFTKYVDGAKGISPEPSNLSILNFNLNMRALADAEIRIKKAQVSQEAQRLSGLSDEEKKAESERWAGLDLEVGAAEALDELVKIVPAEEGERLQLKQAELVAKLLQDSPSQDQIMGLPGRVRAAYFGWIYGQLMSPEFGAAGMTS